MKGQVIHLVDWKHNTYTLKRIYILLKASSYIKYYYLNMCSKITTGSVGAISRPMEVQDTFQYVPLLDGLVSLLSSEDILNKVNFIVLLTYFVQYFDQIT